MTSPSKVWFVTGASSGLGRVWTDAALSRGDRVVATARNPHTLADLVARHRGAVLPLPLDVTDRTAVFDALRRGHAHFGRVDVVLNGAGYGYMGAVEELDPQEARANFETNLFGTLSVIQAALPLLRAQGHGHILTLSSIGGMVSLPTGGAYLATKWAIEALSEALAGEVASFGIKVTIIEPGSFSTGFRAATRIAPALPAYATLRETVRARFDDDMIGDPHATAAAILQLVDSKEPPLRLILGDWLLPMVKQAYRERIDTWQAWSDVSDAAQGRGHAKPHRRAPV